MGWVLWGRRMLVAKKGEHNRGDVWAGERLKIYDHGIARNPKSGKRKNEDVRVVWTRKHKGYRCLLARGKSDRGRGLRENTGQRKVRCVPMKNPSYCEAKSHGGKVVQRKGKEKTVTIK